MSGERKAGLRFCKMSGAGNDFILINVAHQPLEADCAELARALCPRRVSVGADGLILVGPADGPDADLRVRFWNPDGSEPATCGNGTRCAALFAVLEGLAADSFTMDTAAGPIMARVDGERVALRYSTRPGIQPGLEVTTPDGPVRGHRVEVGNSHFVVSVDELPGGPIEPICRPLREAPELAPTGANVHLVKVVDRGRIRIRTYELGVEAETLACGSGSMSSAMALAAAGALQPPITVETRSGEELVVRFRRHGDQFHDLELEGPARVVYYGELSPRLTGRTARRPGAR
jgi:diaminopimelate epimerase